MGTRFIIYFADPNEAEIVINHPNTIDKGGVYKYIEEMIGGPGLFTSVGKYIKVSLLVFLIKVLKWKSKLLNKQSSEINFSVAVKLPALSKVWQ